MSNTTLIKVNTVNNPDGPGSSFTFDGHVHKILQLQPNITYTFDINTIDHPFYLSTTSNRETNRLTTPIETGKIEYKYLGDNIYYHCLFHPPMTGQIISIPNNDTIKTTSFEKLHQDYLKFKKYHI